MMTFDDVSLPAEVYVCISMVVALVGNSLVLLVFGCRWRTTNDTRIYIMTLAVLDLVCATVSFPRDLISLSPCLVGKSHMHVYCKLSVFLTHHLNVTSALILVTIAVSRYVKVTKRENRSDKIREPGMYNAFKARMKRIIHAMKTVRGAKISVTVAFCLAFFKSSPALIIYGAEEVDENSITNTSEIISSGTANEDQYTCHSTCRDEIRRDFKVFRKVFEISQFGLFVILTVILIGIYSVILQKLFSRKNSKVCCSNSAQQDSSVSYPDEPTISSMVPLQHETDGNKSETQDVFAEEECTEPASPSSDGINESSVCEDNVTSVKQRGKLQSDSVLYRKKESTDITFFPPLSYSSDHWSEVCLNRQTSKIPDSPSHNNRLSTASFQLTRTGNQARMTTLVFLLVTLIYIVSYCPYFVFILSLYAADPEGGDPQHIWESLGSSRQAVMEICRRSYLIANAANPLVYGLCNPFFREQLGKLLICRRDVI
ncbi:hypothetical protein ACOMHN_052113 [Nucella lapillus]